MNGIEGEIRDALRRQADLAPQPGPVLAALHRSRTGHRLRLGRKASSKVLVAMSAVVVLVVALVVVARAGADDRLGLVGENVRVYSSVGFSPRWLPEGFLELRRDLSDGVLVARGWQVGSGVGVPVITLAEHWSKADLAPSSSGERTTVNGAAGYFGDRNLVWAAGADRYLSVEVWNVADPRGVLRRVAESVRPDGSMFESPVGLAGAEATVISGTSRDDWTAEVTTPVDGVRYRARLFSVDREPGPARPVHVLGRMGRYREEDAGVLTIPLAAGRYLSISGTGSRVASADELTRVAGLVRFSPYPDLSWLGR